MKSLLIIIAFCISTLAIEAQSLTDLDKITPLFNEVAAVQKGDSWGFIDTTGVLTVPFRQDFVSLPCPHDSSKKHPYFSNERALIKVEKDKITYFGYIDKTGNTIINPEFVGATVFNETGYAIVQKLNKEVMGKSDILEKELVRYTYNEVVINRDGEIVAYLTSPKHLIPNRGKFYNVPKIKSYFIGGQLVAYSDDSSSWNIKSISNE